MMTQVKKRGVFLQEGNGERMFSQVICVMYILIKKLEIAAVTTAKIPRRCVVGDSEVHHLVDPLIY